jgi:hypothetical protein
MGFARLDYAAWCTLKDFAPDESPAYCFECLAETAGSIRKGSMALAASRADITVRTAHAGSQGGARANLAMSGAWPQTRRAAPDQLRLELCSKPVRNGHPHRASHRSGDLEQFQTFFLPAAESAISHSAPGVSELWVPSAAALGVWRRRRLAARLRDGLYAVFGNAGSGSGRAGSAHEILEPAERSLYGYRQILARAVDGLTWDVRRRGNGQQSPRDVQIFGTTTPLKDRAVLRLHLVDTGVDVDHHLPRRRRDQSLGDADQVV